MKNRFNKSISTNLLAVVLIIVGYISPVGSHLIKSMGFFALSGAITNWLAIYMLFERVPFLYGSGVIPNQFEAFKSSIKSLMMNQFFTAEHIEQFIYAEEMQGEKLFNMTPLLNAVDYDRMYDSLVSSIMESSFGAMLEMMGGQEALEPLKEPFTEKMQATLSEMVHSERFKSALEKGLDTHKISDDMLAKIESVIDKRLNELTPQLVKEMVQQMIHQHLGWLVVWGGVFGGVIGALFSRL